MTGFPQTAEEKWLDRWGCHHDRATELAEQAEREACERGECSGAPVCGYCLDEKNNGSAKLGRKQMEPENGQAVAKRDPRPLEKAGFAFLPKTWEDLFAYAKEISQTDFVPKSMTNKPGAVLAAWQTGQEVGLPPMSALQSIAIINGRPSIHSNGYWALITSHPLCEWFKETPPDEALKQGYGECTIKRRNNPHVITRRFTMEEAKIAGLTSKDNWKNYPGDMLQNRARHRAGDDAIPEACQGLLPADVARDIEPEATLDVTPTERKETPQAPRKINEAKRKKFFTACAKIPADTVVEHLATYNYTSMHEIMDNQFDELMKWAAEWKPEEVKPKPFPIEEDLDLIPDFKVPHADNH